MMGALLRSAELPQMLLAIDCAGPRVSVCAGNAGQKLTSCTVTARLNHNEILALAVRDALAAQPDGRPTCIAVNVGPGSFTGTRVGVSYAVGLAQGWGIPIIPQTSFELALRLAPEDAIQPTDEWDFARELWFAANCISPADALEPHEIRVRYMGPSQAERNFRARQ